MPVSDDLPLLIEAAQAAGRIAKRHFGAAPQVWDKGQGQGPVSAADLEIDAMLRDRLRGARPDYGWLSEESAQVAASSARHFVIDPIDGTRAFLKGEPGFSHALAVIEQGAPVAAVVFLPMLDLCYTALVGQGAACNGTPLAVRERRSVTGADVLVARPQLDAGLWPGGVPQVTRHFRPSLAWRLALVAEGRFDAMLTLRPTWHWDIAAGALLVQEAGGRVTDGTGAALDFATPEPQAHGIIAAGPELQTALVALRKGK
ncbi:MAG: 3'(2'),5'-bisphosphate nucleotidase CysQ [Rhodobacteraceae bacterium]|nr:3'(2'),5'-bisphosphate nucleotidase CysQ [Paracoccaceae bacterium]TVR47882.1 MAG: 3'(2'),5'-bisphosphate nucleotidase CysQ [Paracoccaceae bacterium]